MGLIYCVRNTVNGKCYIGQTKHSLNYRKRQHEKCARDGLGSVFHKAICKYGLDAFKWSVLRDALDCVDLDDYERAMIKRYNTILPNGYNLNEGGSAPSPTEETKAKLRLANKRQFSTAEARRLHGLTCKGIERTPEFRRKVSEKLTGHITSEETKEKIRIKATGRGHSLETRQRISAIVKQQKNRTKPPSHKGMKRSEETKAKQSAAIFRHYYMKRTPPYEHFMPTCYI